MPRQRKVERAGRGLGSVYPVKRKRSDGTIRVLWAAATTYRDREGHRQRVVVYGDSQAEATEKLKALQNRPEVSSRLAPAKGTVGEFIVMWLDTVVDPNLKQSTASAYRGTFNTHIKDSNVAKRPLAKVNASDVDVLYAKLVKSGVGSRTRLKVHDILAAAFTYAMQRKQIASDPMFGIKRPVYNAPEIKALTREQIDALLTAAKDDPLEALYVLTIFSGLRSGEVLSLTWGNVDLDAGVVTVRTSLQDTGAVGKGIAKRIVAGPKTEKSARPISLPEIAIEALRRHAARQGVARKPRDLVFPNERGKPLWRQNLLRRSFYPLLERAGLYEDGKPLLTFHGLRHVHGTELFRHGIHPKVVQERLGHSRIGITLDTYSSSLPSMQQTAVDGMNRAYSTSTGSRMLHAVLHAEEKD